MLRTDQRAPITSDRYYHVLGYKSEGGAGDPQINLFMAGPCSWGGREVLVYAREKTRISSFSDSHAE